MQRERPRTGLLGCPALRIPVQEACPNLFADGLNLIAKVDEIDARDDPVLHANFAVDDHGRHVVADTAFDKALDRISDWTKTQRIVKPEAPGTA